MITEKNRLRGKWAQRLIEFGGYVRLFGEREREKAYEGGNRIIENR